MYIESSWFSTFIKCWHQFHRRNIRQFSSFSRWHGISIRNAIAEYAQPVIISLAKSLIESFLLLHTAVLNHKPTHARCKSKYLRSSRKFVSSGQIRDCSNRLKDRHSGAQRNRKLKHLPSDFVKVCYRYVRDGRDDIVHRELISHYCLFHPSRSVPWTEGRSIKVGVRNPKHEIIITQQWGARLPSKDKRLMQTWMSVPNYAEN